MMTGNSGSSFISKMNRLGLTKGLTLVQSFKQGVMIPILHPNLHLVDACRHNFYIAQKIGLVDACSHLIY